MNKKYILYLLIVVFVSGAVFIIYRSDLKIKNTTTAFYPIKERTGIMAAMPEWASIKEQGDKLVRIVRETPADLKSALKLATVYIQEGRATGDFDYYNEAALKYVNDVLQAEPNNFEALILKSVVQLSQHRFAEGLKTAEAARNINPYNAYVYGLITDANVELGNYELAVASLDKMVSIRPDLRSYSRISYLREIYGQTEAAIQAMKMAVEAGAPGDEGTEWARVQLGQLYEKAGDNKTAEMHYSLALEYRPGYAYALGGLASIEVANKNYSKAISLLTQADALLHDPFFKEKLAHVYLLDGQTKKANEILDEVIARLNEELQENTTSGNQHADGELVALYICKKQWNKALTHALTEYNRRPNNIETAEAAAWAYYKNNEIQKAKTLLKTALRTGSKNPTLLCRAAIIYDAGAERAKAKNLVQEVFKINPNVDPFLKQQCVSILNN